MYNLKIRFHEAKEIKNLVAAFTFLIIVIYEILKNFRVQVLSNPALLWEMLTFYAHCIIKVATSCSSEVTVTSKSPF